MKKTYLGLAVIFCICTLAGSLYYIVNKFNVSAGYAGISLFFMILFYSLYDREQKKENNNL